MALLKSPPRRRQRASPDRRAKLSPTMQSPGRWCAQQPPGARAVAALQGGAGVLFRSITQAALSLPGELHLRRKGNTLTKFLCHRNLNTITYHYDDEGVLVARWCPTPRDPMGPPSLLYPWNSPGKRTPVLEWVAMPSSRGSS